MPLLELPIFFILCWALLDIQPQLFPTSRDVGLWTFVVFRSHY